MSALAYGANSRETEITLPNRNIAICAPTISYCALSISGSSKDEFAGQPESRQRLDGRVERQPFRCLAVFAQEELGP